MIYLGYRTCSVVDINKEQKVALANNLGMRAVELGLNEIKSEKDAVEWKELSEKYSVEIRSMGIGLNLCDPTLIHECRQKLSNSIKYAKIIGMDVLFSRTDSAPAGVPQKSTWDTCIQVAKECARTCEQNGIRFSIEVDPPCFVENLERLEYLLEKSNEPNLHVNFDPTNLYVRGSDPMKAIERLKHLFTGGHIKDGLYRTEYKGETKIGFGEVDYRQIFGRLKQENIDIIMYFEHCRSHSEVIEANSYINGILEEI